MKVNLVNYEMTFTSQILSKFAWKMSEQLDALGIRNVVSDAPDSSYDVNHHIIYSKYRHTTSVNTLMVTHIDSKQKLDLLASALSTADMAVCMSEHMVDTLAVQGLPREKLTCILPAHDGDIVPIPVAILTNVYPDGRKREGMLNALTAHIDPRRFVFRIMGQSWDIAKLRELGLVVEYYPDFDREIYQQILRDSKYYLSLGLDEGSMPAIDAKRADLKLIATPQGYHIEIGLEYPFTTQDELNRIFLELEKPALADWTWEQYTKQHIALWEKLLVSRPNANGI